MRFAIRVPDTISVSIFLTISVICCAAVVTASSVADRAGIWSVQPVKSTMTMASGTKSGSDVGPARAAALGHLDSDGVIDLVVAYGNPGQAYAVVAVGDPRFRRGAKHDRLRELDGLPPERAFAAESVVYPLPFAPDWAAVGDWDADGDFDVVFAARGLNRLFWMAGDGQSGLDVGGTIKLSGGVTAFASAEVNRPDGLADLVVAVHGATGAGLLVFESPLGALSGVPELQVMPALVTDLTVDWFDDDGWADIAAAAGDSVVVISGRDRKLTLIREKREAVPKATTTSLSFEADVTGLAAGDFVGRDRRAQLAVRDADGNVTLVRRLNEEFHRSSLGTLPVEGRMTSARASGLPGHDLLLLGSSSGRVEIFHTETTKASAPRLESVPGPEGDVSAMTTGRLNLDTRDDLVLLGDDGSVRVSASKSRLALIVTTTDDTDDGACNAAHCSFREAINLANAQPSGSFITFDLEIGSTIHPTRELPALTQPASTAIDGTVGSGFLTGLLRIQGDLAGVGANGLVVSGGNATISHFIIGGFDRNGIYLESDDNTVKGCRIGLDETGGTADPNAYGVVISSVGDDNVIGGTAHEDRNVISGNASYGILDTGGTGSVIMGNWIGLVASGNATTPNSDGIRLEDSEGFRIGSTVPGGGNVISGNLGDGIKIQGASDPLAVPALVFGNTIGLDPSGVVKFPNGGIGLTSEGSHSLTIGGPSSMAGNVISGNMQEGIVLLTGSVYVQVQGNTIGADPSGTVRMGNADGIRLEAAEESTIGGTVPGTGNLISGNRGSGLYNRTGSVAHHIDILGNLIGPAIDGSGMEGDEGVFFQGGQFFTIGSLEAPNTIAMNQLEGIKITQNCVGVSIGPNSIHSNAVLFSTIGIDLGGDGVTPNDPLDADTGPNELQNFPEIEYVVPVTGDVDFYVRSTPSSYFRGPLLRESGLPRVRIRRGPYLPRKHDRRDRGDRGGQRPDHPRAVDRRWGHHRHSHRFLRHLRVLHVLRHPVLAGPHLLGRVRERGHHGLDRDRRLTITGERAETRGRPLPGSQHILTKLGQLSRISLTCRLRRGIPRAKPGDLDETSRPTEWSRTAQPRVARGDVRRSGRCFGTTG